MGMLVMHPTTTVSSPISSFVLDTSSVQGTVMGGGPGAVQGTTLSMHGNVQVQGGGTVSGGGPSASMGMHLDPNAVAAAQVRIAQEQAQLAAQQQTAIAQQQAAAQQAAAGQQMVAGQQVAGGGAATAAAPAFVSTADPNVGFALVPATTVQPVAAQPAAQVQAGAGANLATGSAQTALAGSPVATNGTAVTGATPQAAAAAQATGGGATVAPAQAGATPTTDEIKDYIRYAAETFGVNPELMINMASHESSFRVGVINDNVTRGDKPTGLFQFKQGTFDWMGGIARDEHPEIFSQLGDENITNWQQQAMITAWAIERDWGKHWSVYNTSLREAGGQRLA